MKNITVCIKKRFHAFYTLLAKVFLFFPLFRKIWIKHKIYSFLTEDQKQGFVDCILDKSILAQYSKVEVQFLKHRHPVTIGSSNES